MAVLLSTYLFKQRRYLDRKCGAGRRHMQAAGGEQSFFDKNSSLSAVYSIPRHFAAAEERSGHLVVSPLPLFPFPFPSLPFSVTVAMFNLARGRAAASALRSSQVSQSHLRFFIRSTTRQL